jgi:hypothetical protein
MSKLSLCQEERDAQRERAERAEAEMVRVEKMLDVWETLAAGWPVALQWSFEDGEHAGRRKCTEELRTTLAPAARCDGSGWRCVVASFWQRCDRLSPTMLAHSEVGCGPCPGCPACRPESYANLT